MKGDFLRKATDGSQPEIKQMFGRTKTQSYLWRATNFLPRLGSILIVSLFFVLASVASIYRQAEPPVNTPDREKVTGRMATPTVTPTPQVQPQPTQWQKTGANLAGMWDSNIGLTYQIMQAGGDFIWQVVGLDQTGKGTIAGLGVAASWTGTSGSGSARGTVMQVDPNGMALRIEWDNGVIFTRKSDVSTPTPPEIIATITPTPTVEPTPGIEVSPTPPVTMTPTPTPPPQSGTSLEAIVGPLTSTETVRVRTGLPTGIIPIPISLSNPIPVQLAKFYVYVLHDRLGGIARLDPSGHTLTIAPSARVLSSRDSRAVLKANLLNQLDKVSGAEAAKGGDAMVQWYTGWAQWLDGLGIDFSGTGGHPPGIDPLVWAQTQKPAALKMAVGNRLLKAIDKLSATPIQLP